MARILVGKTTEVMPGQMKKVLVDENEVVVINIDGNYYAMDDTCAHAGASLAEGSLDNSIITCPWHGATWDCKTGKMIKFGVQLKDLAPYKVTVESDEVFVED